MTPDERREEMGINAQIEILEENLQLEQEKVKDIEGEISRWQQEQRPSRQDSVPPFEAERLKRAKLRAEKIKERLEHFKAELRDLHARVKERKKSEEEAERERAEEIPQIAENLANKVESIEPDDLEPIFALARAKQLASRELNAVAKLSELAIERDYLNRTKGYEISELPELTLPVCADELRSAWRGAFDQHWEPKRTVGSRKRTSEIGQMKGTLRDLAAEG